MKKIAILALACILALAFLGVVIAATNTILGVSQKVVWT